MNTKTRLKIVPPLDPGFEPVVFAVADFEKAVAASGRARRVKLALERGPESVCVVDTLVYGEASELEKAANIRHIERLLKGQLWLKGGRRIYVAGDEGLRDALAGIYSKSGARAFDFEMMGRIYSGPMEFVALPYEKAPRRKARRKPSDVTSTDAA
jgi:hypothetical protein